MSSQTTELQSSYPFSPLRVARRSFGTVCFFVIVTGLILGVNYFLAPEAVRMSGKQFNLVCACLIILAWIVTIGKIIAECAQLFLIRYYTEGDNLCLESDVFGSTIQRQPLTTGTRVSITESSLDRLFGLANLKLSSRFNPQLSLDGLPANRAASLYEKLLTQMQESEEAGSPNDVESTSDGQHVEEHMGPAEQKALQERINKTQAEKAQIDSEKEKAAKELEALKAKEREREELEEAQAERQRSAEELQAVQEDLQKTKAEQQESERVEEVKKELSEARRKLELIREEKRTEEELKQVQQEIEVEKRTT